MKVFVTGVGGQLGHDVMNELQKRGHEGIGSDVHPTYSGVMDGSAVTAMPYESLDITDAAAVREVLHRVKPDAVIHCAAWTAVDAAEDPANLEKVKAINTDGTAYIAAACALAGAKSITIINRNAHRGEDLVGVIRSHTQTKAEYLPWSGTIRIPQGTDILINATSVGLHPHGTECPDINFSGVHPGMTVSDVVFNPVDTPFLTQAAAHGARTIDGLGMLVNQGCINYELWTGQPAPRDVMYAKLKAEFGME